MGSLAKETSRTYKLDVRDKGGLRYLYYFCKLLRTLESEREEAEAEEEEGEEEEEELPK